MAHDVASVRAGARGLRTRLHQRVGDRAAFRVGHAAADLRAAAHADLDARRLEALRFNQSHRAGVLRVVDDDAQCTRAHRADAGAAVRVRQTRRELFVLEARRLAPDVPLHRHAAARRRDGCAHHRPPVGADDIDGHRRAALEHDVDRAVAAEVLLAAQVLGMLDTHADVAVLRGAKRHAPVLPGRRQHGLGAPTLAVRPLHPRGACAAHRVAVLVDDAAATPEASFRRVAGFGGPRRGVLRRRFAGRPARFARTRVAPDRDARCVTRSVFHHQERGDQGDHGARHPDCFHREDSSDDAARLHGRTRRRRCGRRTNRERERGEGGHPGAPAAGRLVERAAQLLQRTLQARLDGLHGDVQARRDLGRRQFLEIAHVHGRPVRLFQPEDGVRDTPLGLELDRHLGRRNDRPFLGGGGALAARSPPLGAAEHPRPVLDDAGQPRAQRHVAGGRLLDGVGQRLLDHVLGLRVVEHQRTSEAA